MVDEYVIDIFFVSTNMGHRFEMYSGLLGSLLATVVKGYDGITHIKLDFPSSSFPEIKLNLSLQMLN